MEDTRLDLDRSEAASGEAVDVLRLPLLARTGGFSDDPEL